MNAQWKDTLNSWLRHLTFWRGVAIVILVLGLYATVVRFAYGLGAATNLSDAFPWGLWIGFDVLVGVGLAAGGFVVAATVHVFGIEKYKPISRPTILTAFLGYLLVVVALLFDLGRPYRIWHPLIMWNPHSVMFEVAWCVTLYTTVLALEFSPLVLERLGFNKALKVVHSFFVPLVIVGVLLSTLHQSSLGTLYVIVPDKLYGLWYTPLLPVFFFISAIAAGLSMTIFESFMSRRAFGKELESDLLEGLARACVVVLGLYLVIKVEDLSGRGNLALAFAATPEAVLFWGEIGLGAILPMLLFAIPKFRRNEAGMFLAAVLTIMGFILNRLNVAITGMTGSSGVLYIPSWMEAIVTMSVVTAGFVMFSLAVQYLNIFPDESAEGHGPARKPAFVSGTLPKQALPPLWGLLLVGVGLVLWTGAAYRNPQASQAAVVEGSVAATPIDAVMKLPAPYSFPEADDSPGTVTFNHSDHVDREAPHCGSCHPQLFSILVRGKVSSGEISDERVHEGDLCASCHDGKQAFDIGEECESCHQ